MLATAPRPRPISIGLAIILTITAGGYLIIFNNPVFWCGRVGAFPSLYLIVAAALGQGGLYIAEMNRTYRISQYIALPFVAVASIQIGLDIRSQ